MWFALGSQFGDLSVLVWSLPAIAVLAATNTVNEEFGYRNVPLSVLPPIVGSRAALAVTGLMFGLAHYYGNPPGASGVALSAFLGVLLAKSMIETGGSKWAWVIHWMQDMIIFSFLALAWSNL
jgi:membrane protease YdiL (CAAX protease family)